LSRGPPVLTLRCLVDSHLTRRTSPIPLRPADRHQPHETQHLDDGAWYPVRGTLLCDTATGDRLGHTCRDHPVTSAQADGVAEYAPPHQARRGLRSTTRQARPQWRVMAPAEGPREQSRDWSTMTF